MDRMKLRPPVGRRGRPCPRSARLAYETVTLFKDTSPGGTSHLDLDEVIGDVGSASLATDLLSMLNTISRLRHAVRTDPNRFCFEARAPGHREQPAERPVAVLSNGQLPLLKGPSRSA